MKTILFSLTTLIIGCTACGAAPKALPVELPYGQSGYQISCTTEEECEAKVVGICQNGYHIEKYLHSITSTSISLVGEIIVCEAKRQ